MTAHFYDGAGSFTRESQPPVQNRDWDLEGGARSMSGE